MRMVTRGEWGARTPRRVSRGNLRSPSTGHWNGPTLTVGGSRVWDHSRCASLVRGIQNFHMDGRGWNDIAYNFLECPHGYTFEGRGLNVINGANGTNAGNASSHAICCLAGEGNDFPEDEKLGFRDCVRHIAASTSAPDSAIGHRDHKATACPGDVRYDWIRRGMPTSGVLPPPPNVPGGRPVLRTGDRGDAVRLVQTIIRDRAGGNIAVDGIFGSGTRARVMDLQKFFDLTVDGIVGPRTWDVLNFLATQPPPAVTNPFGDWPGRDKKVMTEGASGDAVTYLQRVILLKAGGNITVDGRFGPQTKRRVIDLQNLFGLSPDGIVGRITWSVVDFLAKT